MGTASCCFIAQLLSMSILEDIRVAIQLFEGLMVFNPHGPAPRLGCAEDWTVDATQTLYTFVG